MGLRTSGTAVVGSVSLFSRLKSYAGLLPEERFSKVLRIHLKRSESISAPAGRHQIVFHLLLTCHNHYILSIVPFTVEPPKTDPPKSGQFRKLPSSVSRGVNLGVQPPPPRPPLACATREDCYAKHAVSDMTARRSGRGLNA